MPQFIDFGEKGSGGLRFGGIVLRSVLGPCPL
jgi:hypothetical protein